MSSNPHVPPRGRRLAWAAFGVYLAVLGGVAFLPLPGAPAPGQVGVVPVELSLSRPNLLGSWEFERNVLMTVPFGLLLPLVVRWRYELLVLACFAVTLLIETSQLLVSVSVGWAWRSFDVNDLFNNLVGALLGLAATGACLLLSSGARWSQRPPTRRLVTGAVAAAVVLWAGVSTATAPAPSLPVDACQETPVGAVTPLPGGASAYADAAGWLCLQGPGVGASSVPPDQPTGMVAAVEAEDGRGLEVGVARPGDDSPADSRGRPVQTEVVAGADLLVWSVALP